MTSSNIVNSDPSNFALNQSGAPTVQPVVSSDPRLAGTTPQNSIPGIDNSSEDVHQGNQPVVGRVDKEIEPIGPKTVEVTPLVEVGEREIPPEIAEYVQKTDKYNEEFNIPIVHHVDPNQIPSDVPVMVLPVTKPVLIAGLKAQVSQSLRWLATWCLRLIKKFKGRIIYSDGQEKI